MEARLFKTVSANWRDTNITEIKTGSYRITERFLGRHIFSRDFWPAVRAGSKLDFRAKPPRSGWSVPISLCPPFQSPRCSGHRSERLLLFILSLANRMQSWEHHETQVPFTVLYKKPCSTCSVTQAELLLCLTVICQEAKTRQHPLQQHLCTVPSQQTTGSHTVPANIIPCMDIIKGPLHTEHEHKWAGKDLEIQAQLGKAHPSHRHNPGLVVLSQSRKHSIPRATLTHSLLLWQAHSQDGCWLEEHRSRRCQQGANTWLYFCSQIPEEPQC